MAISTTTTVNDFIGGLFIVPAILAAAGELTQLGPLCKQYNLVGTNKNGVQIATGPTLWGTPDDLGVGVDTEYDAAEATDLTSTTWSTGVVTATVAEYGARIDISDSLAEDAVDFEVLWAKIKDDLIRVMLYALDDDIAAKFSGFSTSVGTTTANLTVAQALSAFDGFSYKGLSIPDGVVGVFAPIQAQDLQGELVSTNAAAAVYSFAADRFLSASPGPNNGLTNGQVMWFRGYPIYSSGFCDSANAAADRVGAVFVHSTSSNDPFAALGLMMKRAPRLEVQRDASARANELVMTMRAAPFEERDGSGTAVITDA